MDRGAYPWGFKELDAISQLNNNNMYYIYMYKHTHICQKWKCSIQYTQKALPHTSPHGWPYILTCHHLHSYSVPVVLFSLYFLNTFLNMLLPQGFALALSSFYRECWHLKHSHSSSLPFIRVLFKRRFIWEGCFISSNEQYQLSSLLIVLSASYSPIALITSLQTDM